MRTDKTKQKGVFVLLLPELHFQPRPIPLEEWRFDKKLRL